MHRPRGARGGAHGGRPRSRLHQAFGLFLALRAAHNLALGLAYVPGREAFAYRADAYFLLALPFAALYFALVYRERFGLARAGRWRPWALAAAVVGLELAYLLDHGLFGTPVSPGPLAFVGFAGLASYAFLTLVFARDHAHEAPGPRRRALLLITTGFGLDAVFILTAGGIESIVTSRALGFPVSVVFTFVFVVGLLFVIPAALLLARAARRGQGADTRGERRALFALGVACASAFPPALMASTSPGLGARLFAVIDGVWTIALPVLVGYAIVRHRLFDIDVKVKWTIKQSTVAAIFVGVFFVVSEGAQQLFSERAGPLVGILAAGLLVFAIAPLQRFAEKVSNAALPGVRSVGELGRDERLALYREQLRVAWEDGTLDKSERRLLEVAREKLGLSADEALVIERDVVGG